MFPFEAMPRPAQGLAEALPLTHFLRVVRGISLKGSGYYDVVVEFGWMCAILTALLLLASLRVQKRLG